MSGNTMFYPLLCRNSRRSAQGDVLSPDGMTVVPHLPTGGRLVLYSETEVWLWAESCLLEGGGTLIETFQEAIESVARSKGELARLRVIARKGKASDAMELRHLPAADRKLVRSHHLVLQVVLDANEAGLETGFHDFRCSHCGGAFAITLPGDTEYDPGDLPEARMGFAETKLFMDLLAVKCPRCRECGRPEFHWGSAD